jgi:hypothetical protein
MIDADVKIAARRYFNQRGIPTLSAALAAILFVLCMALEAQANSEAKIPRPANKTNKPGPGANKKTVPIMVTNPPTTPTNTRQIREPYGVLLICCRIFIPQVYP